MLVLRHFDIICGVVAPPVRLIIIKHTVVNFAIYFRTSQTGVGLVLLYENAFLRVADLNWQISLRSKITSDIT